jgi:peptidylprolyl isomerase
MWSFSAMSAPSLDPGAALLWSRPHWRNPEAAPKSRSFRTFHLESIMADGDRLTFSLSSGGDVVIKLRPDLAPGHVQRITELANKGFYDGVVFHRVIPGFMAQGGDPTGRGTGGSDLPDLKAEFSREPHVRGTASMARTSDPNSANSQFFIVFDDARFLDGQYTVWGQVESGMEYVDALPVGEPPREPGKIVKATVS